MLPRTPQAVRLRTLIISRILVAVFLIFYAQHVFRTVPLLFYALTAAICVFSAFYLLWWIAGKHLTLLAYVQIACDLVLESILVYYTGGVDSPIATIYVLSILTASFVLSPAASFYAASGSGLFFVGTIMLDYWGFIPQALNLPGHAPSSPGDLIYIFYACYVRLTVFFLVASLGFYFSRMISKLEEQVKTQERLVFLGEVVANIAHEIRNPLASISGSVQLLSKQLQTKLDRKQEQLMKAVVDESDRVGKLFSGLLDFSRVPKLRVEPIALESFLNQIFLLTQYQERFNPMVKVIYLYRGKGIKIKADPEQMKQAILNLIANAYDSMPNGGQLTVDGCVRNRETVISIADTGTGMDRKTLNSLFTPFKTTKSSGTGLGLAQAHKVVSQHGGKIQVESKKGKGTRVEIVLPEN